MEASHFACLEHAMIEIEKGPDAWLQYNRCNNPHPWYKMAELYAEELSKDQAAVHARLLGEWCKRYGLETDDPLAKVLYMIAHTTFKDVASKLENLQSRLDSASSCVSALIVRIEYLETKYKTQDIVELSNGTPAAH